MLLILLFVILLRVMSLVHCYSILVKSKREPASFENQEISLSADIIIMAHVCTSYRVCEAQKAYGHCIVLTLWLAHKH